MLHFPIGHLPLEVFPGQSNWTLNTLEGLYTSSGLGMLWDPPGGAVQSPLFAPFTLNFIESKM